MVRFPFVLFPWTCRKYDERSPGNMLFRPFCCCAVRVGFASTSHCRTQSYDQHLNMVLGDVEETVTTVEVDEDTYEEIVRVSAPSSPDLKPVHTVHRTCDSARTFCMTTLSRTPSSLDECGSRRTERKMLSFMLPAWSGVIYGIIVHFLVGLVG